MRLREAIRARGWRLWDAFHAIDHNDDGVLSMGEVAGALDHLMRCGITFEDLLALPEPQFRRVTVRELIPAERLSEYDRAVALDCAVHSS